MEEFSLRDTCNLLAQELNNKIGDKNIIRLWIENSMPDYYCGSTTVVVQPVKIVCAFMAMNLVNGIISIEFKEWDEKNSTFQIIITGRGIVDAEISEHFKSDEVLLHEFYEMGLGNNVSFIAKDKNLAATISVKLGFSKRNNLPLSSKYLGKKVLIVEDNEVNALVFTSFLEDAGINVELAYNGQEGIDMAWANEFNAIIMDIYMPGMDGIESTKNIRDFNDHVPIIALSASTNMNDKESAMKAGANDYLSKPISSEVLLNTLSKYL